MTADELDAIAARLTGAEEAVRWGLETFHPHVAFAFSGAEDVALIDLLVRVRPDVRVFTLDTGRLPPETYELIERVRDRFGIDVEVVFPDRARVEALVRQKGFYSFRRSVAARKECCAIRKVEPLGRALAGLKAWFTGLRRDQAATRSAARIVEIDAAHGGIVKINPLVDWTHERVWEHIRARRLPYNALHDRGFPSIGCEPCTRAVGPQDDRRAGRWWWERADPKECGLHPPKSG
jgi:phosphoadenosine phosphosulfate reductase